jgi:hypothetical protein
MRGSGWKARPALEFIVDAANNFIEGGFARWSLAYPDGSNSTETPTADDPS